LFTERDWTAKESERLSNFMKNNISRNDQEIFWSEQYAEDYIKKNAEFDAILGVQAWEKMLASTSGISSLLECGCNIGRNIDSLDRRRPQWLASPSRPSMSTKRCAKSPPQALKSQNPDHQTGCARGPLGPPAQPSSLPLIPALNLKAPSARNRKINPHPR
jgi:hypothetical protein